jgi:uncharacterized protein YcbX
MTQALGTVSALWRFPVKSMAGERLDGALLTANGILGDRAYALIDAETGKVVSAKSVSLFPGMLECRATFVEPPQPGRDLPPVRMTLPNGKTIVSEAPGAEGELSAHFGRAVELARVAPEQFTIDQYHPDVEGVDPAGHRGKSVEQKLGTALFKSLGVASPVAEGSLFDAFPLSVMTLSTLRRLGELQPQSRFDQRRFRMNLVVEAPEQGFVENGWVGKGLGVGNDAKLMVAMPDPRCVMTTLAQDELPKDTEIIRALTMHNRLEVPGAGRYPCAGVYAVVSAPGQLSVGDPVVMT